MRDVECDLGEVSVVLVGKLLRRILGEVFVFLVGKLLGSKLQRRSPPLIVQRCLSEKKRHSMIGDWGNTKQPTRTMLPLIKMASSIIT